MMIRDNFVHGDLHGGNILYSMSDDHVTVLDAGIATSLDKRTFAPFGNVAESRCFSPFFLRRVVSKHSKPLRPLSSPILKACSCTLFVRVKLIRWSSISSDSTKQNWTHVSSDGFSQLGQDEETDILNPSIFQILPRWSIQNS